MQFSRDEQAVVFNGRGAVQRLGLMLGRTKFEAGGRISGVVVLHLAKPTGIRCMTVSISGREIPARAPLSRSFRRNTSFFHREVLLSGMEQPRFTQERASQLWNAFLKRDQGRMLSAGEHTYPFSIPLPASLPPSYSGAAGELVYTVAVSAHFPLGRALKVTKEVTVVAIPRAQRTHPMALTYPNSNGVLSSNEISINVELGGSAAAMGESIQGRISVTNPRRVPIQSVCIALENCEWVRPATPPRGSGSRHFEPRRNKTDEHVIQPNRPDAPAIASTFELTVPQAGPPTVEGTTISVLWFLRITLDTDTPLEFKTPLFVYSRR